MLWGHRRNLNQIKSISGKENCYARSKNGCKDLKFEICVGNKYGLTSLEILKVKEDNERGKQLKSDACGLKCGGQERRLEKEEELRLDGGGIRTTSS